jgi:hypothetical protein
VRWSAARALGWIICQAPLELRDWTSEMGPAIRDAQQKLAAAIAEGRVQAWGRLTPQSLFEKMPSDPFRISGLPVVVGPHGEMASLLPHKPYTDRKWHSIEFEADEIKKAWPKPPPEPAKDWMKNEADRLKAVNQIGKRESMIKDCMKATGCTKREAEAAYKTLPDGLRRSRGKPPKNPG